MKKPKFLKKFTLIDYLIILIVIVVIIVGFAHITSTNSSNESESSSYDSSTLNRFVENYLGYYRQGQIVETTVSGFNATNGEDVLLHGTIEWAGDDRGSNVKVLINADDGNRYLAGLYDDVPNAEIYIDTISIETNGSTYNNLTEVTVSPKNVTSLNDVVQGISNNTNYELTTTVTIDSFDGLKLQEVINHLFEANERISIKGSSIGLTEEIMLVRATGDEINYASNTLGSFNGITDEITIRIYNCTSQDLDNIENNFDVINIRRF